MEWKESSPRNGQSTNPSILATARELQLHTYLHTYISAGNERCMHLSGIYGEHGASGNLVVAPCMGSHRLPLSVQVAPRPRHDSRQPRRLRPSVALAVGVPQAAWQLKPGALGSRSCAAQWLRAGYPPKSSAWGRRSTYSGPPIS